MNQILSIQENKPVKQKKEKKRKEHTSSAKDAVRIVRVFAILILLFGIFNIGASSYAMFKRKDDLKNAPRKPHIEVSRTAEKKVTIKVESNVILNDLVYKWNDDTESKISTNGRNAISQEIDLPAGENKIYVRATNSKGQTEVLQGNFSREANITIEIEDAQPDINVSLAGKNEIDYMTYQWNDEEEKKVKVGGTTFEQKIKPPAGSNQLTITAFDINGDSEVITKTIEGVDPTPGAEATPQGQSSSGSNIGEELGMGQGEKPVIDVTVDDAKENFVIKAKDNIGLQKLILTINGKSFQKVLNGEKEIETTFGIVVGENKVEVTAFNLNEQTSTWANIYTKNAQ